MPGLNPRSRGSTGRLVMHHGPSKATAKVRATTEIGMPSKVDLMNAALDRYDVATQEAFIAVITPVLAERDQRITDLYEELRLERIRSDQADRLHARVDRARERRIEELTQEVERANGHAEYLRGELAKSQSVDHLADAIVSAMPESEPGRREVIRQVVPAPPVTPVTPRPVLDLGGLAQAIVEAQRPMITELATALKPAPPSEVEIVRDDMGNVKGARRKKPQEERQSSLPLDQWPVPGS